MQSECPHPIHFATPPTILLLNADSSTTPPNVTTTPSRGAERRVFPPTIRLPATGGILNAQRALLWKEAGLNRLNRCVVRAAFSDNVEHAWRQISEGLFQVEPGHESTHVKWLGSGDDALLLEGSAIQLQLDCPGEAFEQTCVAFRLAGKSVHEQLLEMPSARAVVAGSGSRSHLTIIIVLCVLIVLILIGSVVVWNVCWRLKKDKLVQEIQMQFVAHFRKQQEEAIKAAMAQQHNQMPYGATGGPTMSQSEFCPSSPGQIMQAVPAQKRKLYFSNEFFDPTLLANPPPMAEQFITDLRKMVDVAKERIRIKRHVPHLTPIREEPDVEGKEETEDEEEPVVQELSTIPQPLQAVEDALQQDSPRSGKSVDSGLDSPEESGGVLSENSSDEERASPAEVPTNNGRVQRIVSDIEGSNGTASSSPKPASRIPTLSPKTQRAALSLTDRPPPSPSGNVRKAKKQGYAVFPSDPMLKKSLPRRPKREIPRLHRPSEA
ncbi:unnamed protein product, partial [Mesorhabditis spiculigera]